jgi:hypothetical protein
MFGIPPDCERHATQARKISEGCELQHQRARAFWPAAKAGGCNRYAQGRHGQADAYGKAEGQGSVSYTVAKIARVCHEANRAICEAYGDTSQVPWGDAPDWQKDSALKGVEFSLQNPNATPEDQHEAWKADKVAAGWKLGDVKDPEAKTHPALRPYVELGVEQRVKDHVFRAIVEAMGP